MRLLRLALPSLILVPLAGCPADGDDGPAHPVDAAAVIPDASDPASTHGGIVSIQDVSIANAPTLGHGLTVTALFTAAGRAAEVDTAPGQLAGGCRAYLYDVTAGDPPPPLLDEGTLRVTGLHEQMPDGCTFAADGYRCPIRTASAAGASITPMSGPALVALPGGVFTAADAGRYLELAGPTATGNAGRFPIVAVPGPTQVVVGNPAATAETDVTATYTVVAGAGPVPGNPRDPIADGDLGTIALEPGGGGDFRFAPTAVTAGGAFTPDDATLARLRAFPVDGAAFALRCDGAGGACGPTGDASLMLLRTTDGDPSGLSPFVLPPPRRHQVEILCAFLAADAPDGAVEVPAAAAALIAEAHAASPITRIRVAYMHDGVAIATNPDGPPNPAALAIGHGVIGFTDVAE